MRVTTSLAELNKTDFAVFKQLSKIFENNNAVWAMIAHIVFDDLDPNLPASLSPTVVKFIRNTIGFKGTLVSDDICMGVLHGEIGNKYPEYLEANLILEKYPKTVTTDMLSNEDLQKLTDYGIVKDRYDNIGLKNFLARFPELKAEFIKNLAKITKQIITIDNNYIVLHCSGDIDEMKGICGIDIPTLPAN